ncbi:hypothetical protein FBU30_009623 [Linnemannia zychae]|nr:hypothetical protein FBU30_009623 [Linnemannia zychae]
MQEFLHFVFPPPALQGEEAFTNNAINDLYTHIRPSLADSPFGIQPNTLLPQLLPFQRRSVTWCLQRESAVWKNMTVESKESTLSEKLPLSWELVSLTSGELLIINRLYGTVCLGNDVNISALPDPSGGILAEEMGLGKTVEMMAVIVLHRRPMGSLLNKNMDISTDSLEQQMSESHLSDHQTEHSVLEPPFDRQENDARHLIKSGATLVITPPSILHQWASELEHHAPSLKVFLYIDNAANTITAHELAQFDVVLTTYPVLSKQFNYANQYDRPRRHERRYHPRTSPIVLIEWWRVCLDEAQLIEGTTVSQAAAMTHLIPRVISWAISGTPIKRNINDLFSLLQFLKQEPIASDKRIHKLLKESRFRATLISCFQSIMHRYAKQDVAHELSLPRQYRMVYGIHFTHVERMNYMDKWEQCLAECDLNTTEDTSIEAEGLQTWLTRLRQTCCHPQIGSRNVETFGKTNLRTIDEVLSAMVRQAGVDLYTCERGLMSNRTKRAILQARTQKDDKQLVLFHACDKEISRHVNHWKEKLVEETTKKEQGRAELLDGDGAVSSGIVTEEGSGDDGEKNYHTADDPYITALFRQKEWLLGHHKLLFFQANAYHEREMTNEETEYYERAEALRQQLLKLPEKEFDRLSINIKDVIDHLLFNDTFSVPASKYYGGFVLSRHLDELESIRNLLNTQLEILGRWRKDLVDRLTQPLMQDGEEGEQYQYSIDLQHTLESYLHYYNRMVLLRKDLISGTKEAIAKVVADAESQRERENMIKRRENRVRRFKRLDGVETQQTEEDLDKQLEKEMDGLITSNLRSTLRSIRFDIKSLSNDSNLPLVERQMIEMEELRLKEEQSRQTKLIMDLEKEISRFRTLTAARTAYYRQLQEISDTVRDIQSMDPHEDIAICLHEELMQQREIVRLESKLRYLQTLVTSSKHESQSEDDKLCLVCRSQYDRGLMTECGHVFCENCLIEWTKAHATCPTCNSRVVRRKLVQVIMSDSITNPLAEEAESLVDDQSLVEMQDSIPDVDVRLVPEAIRRTIIRDGYGSKIDSIVRHIVYLVQDDPNVKCLVFSQWSTLLGLVGESLDRNNIGHVKLDGASVKSAVKLFNEDKNKRVFMLHAKSQSAGLTLLSATHVFICEPLINPVLQAQAVSRVHRIGQTKETFVHFYLIRDTVEMPCFDLFERNTALNSAMATSKESDPQQPHHPHPHDESLSTAIIASEVSKAQNRHGEMVNLNDLRFIFRMQKIMLKSLQE